MVCVFAVVCSVLLYIIRHKPSEKTRTPQRAHRPTQTRCANRTGDGGMVSSGSGNVPGEEEALLQGVRVIDCETDDAGEVHQEADGEMCP